MNSTGAPFSASQLPATFAIAINTSAVANVFFFQAEDGIRGLIVTGVQTCALPIFHAGSSYRHPVTSLGWPSWYVEDYCAHSQGFQSQVASLVCEGVFVKYPKLKAVLLESGVSWLPAFLWRLSKFWRGV